jgi:beta-mannanase
MARSNWKHDKEDPVYKLQRIIDGQFDGQLEQWAVEARDSRIPLIIEFGTEVNNAYHSWSGKHHGGGRTSRYGNRDLPDGPERFRDAYRHIINIFRGKQAKDITWVLHVDARPDPDDEWNKVKYYYPGDDYIDWIGISAYGQQKSDEQFMTFEQLINNIYPQIQEASAIRPLAILEFGIRERADKAKWIGDALDVVKSPKFPRIKAISYWNANHQDKKEKVELRIDSSTQALDTYKNKIKDSFFLGTASLG